MSTRDRALGFFLLAVATLSGCNGTSRCLDLNDRSPGERYAVGTVIHTADTDLTVGPFQYLGGTWASDGQVRTGDGGIALGTGIELRMRVASIALAPQDELEWLSFRFTEGGGNGNLRINSELANVADLPSLNGTVLGGVLITVDWVTSGDEHSGQVQLAGPIVDFAVGGLDLTIDDLCFLSADVPVGSSTWARSYGEPSSDLCYSVVATNDGGVVMSGMSDSVPPSPQTFGVWIMKLDDDGEVEWQRKYATDAGYRHVPSTGAADGSVLVSDQFQSGMRVLRLSSLGALEWAKVIQFDVPSSPISLSRSADGGAFVMGFYVAPFPGPGSSAVVRLDTSGAVIWSKRYSLNESLIIGACITTTNEGGCAVVGTTHDRIWIAELDALGNIEWQKEGTAWRAHRAHILQTSDGGYLITNIVADPTLPPSQGMYDVVATRLDPLGNVSWQKQFRVMEVDYSTELVASALELSSGGFIVVGAAEYPDGNFPASALAFELGENGDLVWQRWYGGSDREIFGGIAAAANGHYFLAGSTRSFGAGHWDAWVCKVAADGSIAGSCHSGEVPMAVFDPPQAWVPGSAVASNLPATVTDVIPTPIDTEMVVEQQCP